MPETILFVNLMGALFVDERYTLYPATGEALGLQLIVTEWGLSDPF
ncbi:MAG TPA: hypothetical protein VGP19_12100 [Candidatus Acidoferrales bacterium]|nr:hypothetical protein [Candidatus Acidoferrales bacterium]